MVVRNTQLFLYVVTMVALAWSPSSWSSQFLSLEAQNLFLNKAESLGVQIPALERMPGQTLELPEQFKTDFKKFGDLTGDNITSFVTHSPKHLLALLNYLEQLLSADAISKKRYVILAQAAFLGMKRYVDHLAVFDSVMSPEPTINCESMRFGCTSHAVVVRDFKILEVGLCGQARCQILFSEPAGFNPYSKVAGRVQLNKIDLGSYDSSYMKIMPSVTLLINTEFNVPVAGSGGGVGRYCNGQLDADGDLVARCFESPVNPTPVTLRSGAEHVLVRSTINRLVISNDTKGLSLLVDTQGSISAHLERGVVSYKVSPPILKVSRI